MTTITLIDYGLSNIISVQRAFEKLGASVQIVENATALSTAQRLVLPGVSAFGSGMSELASRGLIDPLREHIRKGNPFLGICLGMQLLFDSSEEHATARGLCALPGRVRHLGGLGDTSAKIPNVGWETLAPVVPHPILDGVLTSESFYFVHSYVGVPERPADVIANARFGSKEFPAIVGFGKTVGCQFHPEKSGWTGLKVLSNFLKL